MIKEIAQKIITILKADSDLNFDWYFEPPVRAKSFPYGFVDFRGGERVERTIGKSSFKWTYYIVIVDRKRSDTDNVEKAVMDRTDKAVAILNNNPYLDGLVQELEITAVEGDYVATDQGNFIGTRITIQVTVWL